MDPQYNSEGKPYGPWRYNEIVKECYYISKQINTSYNDLMDITPTERLALMKNIMDDIKKQNEAMEESKKRSKK